MILKQQETIYLHLLANYSPYAHSHQCSLKPSTEQTICASQSFWKGGERRDKAKKLNVAVAKFLSNMQHLKLSRICDGTALLNPTDSTSIHPPACRPCATGPILRQDLQNY